MSTFNRKSVCQMAAIVSMALGSFAASAEQINLNQLVAYNMSQQLAELKYQLDGQLQQSVYDSASGQINVAMSVEGRRPVIKIKDIKATQKEAE